MVCRVGRVSGLAAAAGPVIVISSTAPGLAVDAAPKAPDIAVMETSAIERPGRRLRKPVPYRPGRSLCTARVRSDCAGSWCGQQFVLIIGVAY